VDSADNIEWRLPSIVVQLRDYLRCCGFIVLFVANSAVQAQQLTAPAEKADFIAANLDRSVSPGNDFFEYANGGWFKRNPIPSRESSWGLNTLVRDQLYVALRDINAHAAAKAAPPGSDEQMIGDFWVMGMDVQRAQRLGVRPMQQELARIEGVKNLQQALDAGFALKPLGVDAFFDFVVDQDSKNSQVICIYISQGGLGLPNRDFYLNTDKSIEHIRSEYVAHNARLLRLLGRSEADATKAAVDVMAFETSLAKASRKLEDTRDPLANYHRMTLAQLTRDHTPSIIWVDRLAAWGLRPDSLVVRQPEYFDALEQVLAHASIPVLKDYLRLRLVSDYASYLSAPFVAEDFEFNSRLLEGQKQLQPRWMRVLESEDAGGFGGTADPMGMLVGHRFVSEHFSAGAKQRYSNLLQSIEAAYRQRIMRLEWMGDATKASALRKLAALRGKISYPDHWLDYSGLVIGRSSYCENMMNIARWGFAHMVAKFGRPVDHSEWRMTPQTWDAYYNAANNELVVPAAMFIVPGVADTDVDDAVVYGYVGASTIGHEITHGFDDRGRKFDAAGNLTDWWTVEDATRFEQRASAIVRQFDAYQPFPGFHINGKASLGENIADYGGVLLALDAFKQTEQYRRNEKIGGLTPLQRFFLGYAYGWMVQQRPELIRRNLLSDVHAPPKWRVVGPLSNIPDFYQAFDVKPGQPMWRTAAERASIW
jgi:putative endopeptidase